MTPSWIVNWAENGRDVYCSFDKDEKGYDPRDASRLKAMVEKHGCAAANH